MVIDAAEQVIELSRIGFREAALRGTREPAAGNDQAVVKISRTGDDETGAGTGAIDRSEERRVGKECRL